MTLFDKPQPSAICKRGDGHIVWRYPTHFECNGVRYETRRDALRGHLGKQHKFHEVDHETT